MVIEVDEVEGEGKSQGETLWRMTSKSTVLFHVDDFWFWFKCFRVPSCNLSIGNYDPHVVGILDLMINGFLYSTTSSVSFGVDGCLIDCCNTFLSDLFSV